MQGPIQNEASPSPTSPRLPRWLQNLSFFLVGLLLGALLLAYLRAGEIYEYADTVDGVHLPPVDVIVVLAGGRGRLSAGSDLWYRYREKDPAKKVILFASGLGSSVDWPTLRKLFRKGLQDVIRPEDVVLETQSGNTYENAAFFLREAKARGWNRILLVTSRYHMRRSQMMFDRLSRISGHPLLIESSSVYQEPYEPGEWRLQVQGIQVTLTEYLKWIYYRMLWRPKPLAD